MKQVIMLDPDYKILAHNWPVPGQITGSNKKNVQSVQIQHGRQAENYKDWFLNGGYFIVLSYLIIIFGLAVLIKEIVQPKNEDIEK